MIDLKCSALSASINVVEGTLGMPLLGAEGLLSVVGLWSLLCFLRVMLPHKMSHTISYPREWLEKKPKGLSGTCTQTTKMEMKQWQVMVCCILKELCQGTCFVFKVNCGFPVMCDRSCMFLS